MENLIELVGGRDSFAAIIVFIGCVIRAGQGEKVPALSGLVSAFTPFFVVLCLLYVFEWMLSWFGLTIPPVPFVAIGGIAAFLGNSWIIGLIKDGKSIEEAGALASLASLAKSILTFKKQSS